MDSSRFTMRTSIQCRLALHDRLLLRSGPSPDTMLATIREKRGCRDNSVE